MKIKILISVLAILLLASFASAECTDSDGGQDYSNKGITSSKSFYDGTLWPSDEIINREDTCCINCLNGVNEDGPNSRLREFYCENDVARAIIYSCSGGCSNGACIKPIVEVNPPIVIVPTTEEICKDDDGGKNYYIQGTATGWEKNWVDGKLQLVSSTDGCSYDGKTLGEVYCDGKYLIVEQYTCPNKCVNGVCLREQPTSGELCKDTDNENVLGGIDYFKKGVTYGVYEGKKGEFTDYCYDDKRVFEYYCSNSISLDISSAPMQYCDYGCKDGACLGSPAGGVSNNIGFFTAYMACYDGYDEGVSDGTICRSSIDWQKFAEKKCQDKCNEIGKCGVNTLKVSNECFIDTIQPVFTGTQVPPKVVDSTLPEGNVIPVETSVVLDETQTGKCSSCLTIGNNGQFVCVPFGTRYNEQYCDISQQFLKQKQLEVKCENDYECLNNDCKDGKCVSTYSLLEKILDFLKNLFK